MSLTLLLAIANTVCGVDLKDTDGRRLRGQDFSVSLSRASRHSGEGIINLFQMAGMDVAPAKMPDAGWDASRKNVIWLHLHNFGGTFMCQEAERQGERVNGGGENCNWPGDGCTTPASVRTHCNTRADKGQPLSFSMLERDMDDGDFCGHALYGTMLRDPIAGLTSTLHQNFFIKSEIMAILRSGNSSMPARHLPCLPPGDTYQHFDNFATRSLSGWYSVPPGGVTEEHLAIAKQRLARMDVVLILEELGEHVQQLSSVFGWDLSYFSTSDRKNYRPPTGNKDFTDEELAFLTEVNKYDYALYAFAREVAKQISNRSGLA